MRMAEGLRSVRWVFDCSAWKPSHVELLKAFSSIQSEEKERIGKFVFMKDAKSSLVGRLLMRKFISDASGISWNKINISRDRNGKPQFCDESSPPINFNVSHQGRYVVLAGEVGDQPVGVDTMEMKYSGGKSIPEFFRLMNRNFDPQEWQTIRESQNESDQERMFFRFWCLKESYVKAIGTGITVDLRSIVFKIKTKVLSVGSCASDTALFVSGVEQKQWEFHETLIDEMNCCCVAVARFENKSYNKTFQFISFDKIIENYQEIIPVDAEFCTDFLKKE